MSRESVTAFIALGANLGDARQTVLTAIESASQLPETQLLRVSSLYRSAPFEADGPDFINAVIAVQTRLNAHELLLILQQIEAAAGRLRPFKNAPRTLDMDILLYGDAQISSPTLTVPHLRMWERAFVLLPLAEIAPERVNAAQLAAVADQCLARLD